MNALTRINWIARGGLAFIKLRRVSQFLSDPLVQFISSSNLGMPS